MWKLLQLIFVGHEHKWRIYEETHWSNDFGESGKAFGYSVSTVVNSNTFGGNHASQI